MYRGWRKIDSEEGRSMVFFCVVVVTHPSRVPFLFFRLLCHSFKIARLRALHPPRGTRVRERLTLTLTTGKTRERVRGRVKLCAHLPHSLALSCSFLSPVFCSALFTISFVLVSNPKIKKETTFGGRPNFHFPKSFPGCKKTQFELELGGT